MLASAVDSIPLFDVSVRSTPSEHWDAFVLARSCANIYTLGAWVLLAHEVFGHATYFLEARDKASELIGVLPVVQQRSFLLGNFATSLPFFTYGGVVSDRDDVVIALMSRAQQLAQELGCSYLEFRDSVQRPGKWGIRTDKVSMVLQLPKSFAELSRQLGSKLRSQVKRADRQAHSVRIGGAELVDDFYNVFAQNMRDLGTPVYPRKFFEAILKRCPQYCHILVINDALKPVAAAFLVIHNRRAEIPWAACLAVAKPLGFNMKLYWEVLSFVCEQGCTHFDFGRSTMDSGTYQFKKQWGSQPVQLYWHRWEREIGASLVPSPQSGNGVMHQASKIWKRLPLRLANTIGPLVSPYLPW